MTIKTNVISMKKDKFKNKVSSLTSHLKSRSTSISNSLQGIRQRFFENLAEPTTDFAFYVTLGLIINHVRLGHANIKKRSRINIHTSFFCKKNTVSRFLSV